MLANDITPNDFDPLSCVTPASKVFKFNNLTYLELEKVFKEAKACKASGLDKISNKLLKASGNTIIESLHAADEMKFAKATPIYKTGEKSECSTYICDIGCGKSIRKDCLQSTKQLS